MAGTLYGVSMAWDPSILRKYNITGHFRLINQLRSELRGNPLIRPKEGETIGDVNRSRSLIRALEVRPRSGGGQGRFRRPLQSAGTAPVVTPPADDTEAGGSSTFRERLNAIEMR